MEELENEISTQAEENTVSLASAQALADALAKIEVYTPTTWVDNSSPDIDAEHLNKPEQAIKRVTDALNSAVDVIKDLQSQVTKNSGAISDVNNNLSKKADATSLSSYALKSDLTAYSTKAQLESTFINLTNKRYVKITAAENYSNYGIIFAVTSHGILCVYSENGNFTTLFESAGNSVKISASGLVTTIDCVSTYTHGFILRGGSLKDMPYEISQS